MPPYFRCVNEFKLRFEEFLDKRISQYYLSRDRLDKVESSNLSENLAYGEISPRQIWHAVLKIYSLNDNNSEMFVRQLAWRDFAWYLCFHCPHILKKNWKSEWDDFPWTENSDALVRWQRGITGVPIVDAGMRELYATGWMHNRVRMIVASFLVKHLLIDWKKGERWFFDTLVDGDFCSNNAGWQWTAGCGADAAPYYRIFNPILQGKKFDTAARYVRKWVPEIADIPNESIHAPWELSEAQLQSYGVTLGKTYPEPIVNHEFARKRALETFDTIAPKN